MRLFSTLAIAALAATPVLAVAQAPAPAAPAQPAQPAAPAAAAAKPAYSTAGSTMGALLENADAKAIVFKYVPELAQAGDQLSQAAGLTLKDLQQYLPNITDKVLADMDVDLAKVPAKK